MPRELREIPLEWLDTDEDIVLTQEEYPNLPAKKITMKNPRKLKENLINYHKAMVEGYYKGHFNKTNSEKTGLA